MSNNLWVFGCSVSDENQPKKRKDYVNWKGYVIKTWSELLSEKLNYTLKNYGVSGGSNLTILENFSKECNNMEKDDIVILNWTEVTRFRLGMDNEEWWNVLIQHLKHPDLEYDRKKFNENNISISTLEEIIYNRENKLYYNEIDNWNNLLSNYCKNIGVRYISWGMNICREYMINMDNDCLFNGISKKYGTIEDETNHEIMDGHFGEKSHYELCELFTNIIHNE